MSKQNCGHCHTSHDPRIPCEVLNKAYDVTAEEEEAWAEAEKRMDIIARNGDHYDEGRKFDSGKPAMDLMPPLMEMEVAKVLTFGAIKYDAENWRNVPDLHVRYRSAAKRHINAMKQGETHDEESGLHHAAHAICCLMFIGEIDLESAKE